VPRSVRRTILFHREYRGFTGGHLKVWQYYCHAGHSRLFHPEVYFTPDSHTDSSNPWRDSLPNRLDSWQPNKAGALFLAGMDWLSVPTPSPAPVINLIQGTRHAERNDERRQFLSRPAIRICVSEEVAAAIKQTGEVNGPVHVIPNAIDLDSLPIPPISRDIGILVMGAKNPLFAVELTERLESIGASPLCLNKFIPRNELLLLLARCKIAVTLPYEQEGFFLPALEAMALGSILVCPDCIGNRSFVRNGETAFMPEYTLEAVFAAILRALQLDDIDRTTMLNSAKLEVLKRRLERERSDFLQILDAL
jgi:hypothetical protein